MMGGLDYVKTEVISVPLIRDATIAGYFLARLVYTVDADRPEEAARCRPTRSSPTWSIPTSTPIPKLDFTKVASARPRCLSQRRARQHQRARCKFDLVKDVLIEQIDYLSKDEIRDNALRRQAAGLGKTEPREAESGDGHKAPAH